MIDIQVFSKAGIGKNNEDYVLHSEIAPDVTLVVVCDGMGGLAYGADASKIIAHSLENYLRQNLYSHPTEQSIIKALYHANDELAKECVCLKSKMGASVGLTLFVDNVCYYTWLGDVRIYITKGGKIELLTKDHLAIEGNHSFLCRCINGKELRHSPEVGKLAIDSCNEIFIATDGYYLHNEVGASLESVVVAEDDATIVCIRGCDLIYRGAGLPGLLR